MAYKITWSAESKSAYLGIIDYLAKEWSEKEIINFVNRVHFKLELLSEQPALGKPHKKKYNIHKTLVHKHVSLVYHIKTQKKEIVLLTFWDSRQEPGKLKH